MSIRINTNIEALNAQRNLASTAVAFGKSVEKLSSGLPITRAADDAAGLAISEKLRAQARGLNQAQRNAPGRHLDGPDRRGHAERSPLNAAAVRELAVQYANGTNDSDSQAAIEAEGDALQVSITDFTANTAFNGVALLVGGGDVDFQTGADAGQITTVTFGDVDVSGADVTDIDSVDTEITAISTLRGTLGASQNQLEHVVANLGVAAENMSASESRIRDLDVAAEMVTFTKLQILQQAGTAVLARANQAPQSVLALLR